MTKETALGGVAILGTGGTAGYGIYVYTRPNTIGTKLQNNGHTIIPFADSIEDKYKRIWKIVVVNYKAGSEKLFNSSFSIDSITESNIDTESEKLRNKCKGVLDTVVDENNNGLYESSEKWCVIPKTLDVSLILKDKKPISPDVTGSKQTELLKKGYDKYFVEVGSSDKLGTMEGASSDSPSYNETSGHTNLKTECKKLFEKTNGTTEDENKASKWCVEFTSLGGSIDEGSPNGTEEKWKEKYEIVVPTTGASPDETLKKALESFKSSTGTEDKKKADALKKWCKIAVNAENSDKAKLSYCILKALSA